ncbi:hypothetical protein T4C_10861 [Trichinella pseudospiralis]|uniref:Uncharacterized protein n=1 Tax=Trichinella pseudospiralis TaxID=6337 RepID=A0A0V1JZV6_TRIPS|nr:hypothetical protein T4C_10861 [Trichinella pseudospiralis]
MKKIKCIILKSTALLRNEYRFFLVVNFNEERFRRDFVDLIETAFLLDFFTLFFLDRLGFLPLLDVDFAAALPATFLPRLFLFVILLDLERDCNDCKHDGQIISADISSPSNATADVFLCNPNLDDGLKDCRGERLKLRLLDLGRLCRRVRLPVRLRLRR